MFHVYIIQSKKTQEIYIGYTNNLEQRIKQHNLNKSFSTKYKSPCTQIYNESYQSRKDAKTREHRLKYYGRALAQLKRRMSNSFLEA